ncbi:lipopolysaccharide biosynthesis protein [Aurantiacibacter aquimixticola]|uniref:Lipopolysaccharide biosynthesis protein n=2 Tax=Aurantiacibacter aquimixticola TaxID=1958945 RepID=A0A419RWB3_9SPHN|nr:lipopolysaccharide biosynthesis protein [Aurantiacibacter aquimixticola]RJY10082.1 lipopolysaccharide biosynthesis protein [Aurantiacibacter aquimixticola]
MNALVKGGRTNTLGFVIRLLGGIPFLFIGYRLYGVEEMGRFASAVVVVELFALICALGEKRGLAQRLTLGSKVDGQKRVNLVFDGMLASLIISSIVVLLLAFFPYPIFPNGMSGRYDILIIGAIPAFALTEILLAAQAYRFDIATTVRARAVVEPWTRSFAVVAFFFIPTLRDGGVALAYLVSIYAALAAAAWPFFRTYGPPRAWRPRPRYLIQMIGKALPLAGADVIERGTRLIDVFILGLSASPTAVGIYYFAKEVASLPQKLKTSFEPVLSPVITKNLKTGDFSAIAKQVRQVGFWIVALQLGIALSLAIPGEAVMGLGGPAIVGGTGALALLLVAEAVASMAVVSEGVLVYIAKKRNLAISTGVIALQIAMTVGLIMLVERLGLDDGFKAAGAATALLIALGISSVVKALLLKKLLGAPVGNLRMALVWATGAAVIVGQIAILLPEWLELAIGIPAILAAYGWVIWTKGFGPEDRVLFRKSKKVAESDGKARAQENAAEPPGS